MACFVSTQATLQSHVQRQECSSSTADEIAVLFESKMAESLGDISAAARSRVDAVGGLFDQHRGIVTELSKRWHAATEELRHGEAMRESMEQRLETLTERMQQAERRNATQSESMVSQKAELDASRSETAEVRRLMAEAKETEDGLKERCHHLQSQLDVVKEKEAALRQALEEKQDDLEAARNRQDSTNQQVCRSWLHSGMIGSYA